MLYIIGGKIWTMAGQIWEKGYLCIAEGKIKELGPIEQDCLFHVPEEAQVIHAEGCIVMPGLIEAHCHMGIIEEKMGKEGDDCNENMNPVTPWLRGIDAINTMDASFQEAVKAGITSAMIGPGSANVVGGQFVFLKTWGRRIDNLIVREPAAMKIAFGENPKVNYAGQSKSPVTRMGIAGCLREELTKAKIYMEKRNNKKNFKEDFRYECWVPVFQKQIPLKAHAHRVDDIFTAIRIAREFDLLLSLDHCSEGHLIAEEIAAEGYPVIIGPGLSSRNKIELQNMAFETAGILNRAGAMTAITTDHPVSLIQFLPICAGLAVKAGLDYWEGLKSVTIYPAMICNVDDRVGSLEAGKDADIAIFSGDPLAIRTQTMCTIIGGEIAYMDKAWEKGYNI